MLLIYVLFLKKSAPSLTPHILRQVFLKSTPSSALRLFAKVSSRSPDPPLAPLSTLPSALPLFIAYVYLCPAVVWNVHPLRCKLVFCRLQ